MNDSHLRSVSWRGCVAGLFLGLGLSLGSGFFLHSASGQLSPAPDERSQAWANRDSPQKLEEVATRFSEFLNLGDSRTNGLGGRPALRKIAELVAAKKPVEVLEAFEKYFCAKLSNPDTSGLSMDDLSPYADGVGGFGNYPPGPWAKQSDLPKLIEQADALLQGKTMIGDKEVDLGLPGSVNWYYPLPYGQSQDPARPAVLPNPAIVTGVVFWPLAKAFAATQDRRYLTRWVEYMDDWSVNATYLDSLHPCFVPSVINSSVNGMGPRLAKLLGGLSSVIPGEEPPLPPRVFAQVMMKAFGETPLLNIVYLRSNTHNWTPGASLMLSSLMGDEFITSPLYFRESKRRNIEDNAVTQNLRDGTENQQDPWYNHNYHNVIGAILLMNNRDRMPSWTEVSWVAAAKREWRWMDEVREHLKERVTYQIHIRTPQNEWPIPFRGGDKRAADRPPASVSPEAYADSVNRSIIDAVSGVPDAVPPYTSEWFPYGGYNIVRDGWSKASGYGAMFSSPQPGAYGAYRSRSNNNVFGMAAAGQDLLVDDTVGHYMYPSSPIKVDGKNQMFHARDGVYKVGGVSGHKSYLVSAWTEPAPWRWHASERLNLMEGIYTGPYGSAAPGGTKQGQYGPEEGQQGATAQAKADREVTHQRLVQYLRGPKLWIVTDRMVSKTPHDYGQVWMFPLAASGFAFEKEDFVIDPAHQTISTEAGEVKNPQNPKAAPVQKANVSLYQFSSTPLTYKNKIVPKDEKNHYMVYGRNEVTASWHGEGVTQVVTLIQPRPDGAPKIGSVTPTKQGGGVVGFDATAADGTPIHYLSSPTGEAVLAVGDLRMRGESLLVVGNYGMALGCKEMYKAGSNIPLQNADFEFTQTAKTVEKTIPIYRPISPVIIGPQQNVFVDHIDVTMTSKTPGVEIRYTLDGSEPTPKSAIYTAPVRIDRSVVIKARAYRPGVTENPMQMSGTQATAISSAVFDRSAYGNPLPKTAAKGNGLRFSYWQADWKELWVQGERLKPTVSDTVPTLWDLTKVPNDNPPVGDQPSPRQKYYAVQYEGYLDIPQDGVYTFHAPREFVYPDTDAGYELRLFVGNKMGSGVFSRRIVGINEWYPSTRLHALGNWSVPLAKGLQPFKLFFLDYRTDAVAKLNQPGLKPYVWPGSTPELLISGPGLDKQPIPANWFRY